MYSVVANVYAIRIAPFEQGNVALLAGA